MDYRLKLQHNTNIWVVFFQSNPNIFKEHLSHTLPKASEATYKVHSYCVPLGNSPPELTIK